MLTSDPVSATKIALPPAKLHDLILTSGDLRCPVSPLRPKNDFNAEQVACREEHGHIRSLKFLEFWLVMASCGEFSKG